MGSSKARKRRKSDALRNLPDGTLISLMRIGGAWRGTIRTDTTETARTAGGLIGLVSTLAIAAAGGEGKAAE